MNDRYGLFSAEGYILEEPLGEDAWGELYRARYERHATEVMLRRLPPGLAADEGAWRLTCSEVQAWARLDHPGILKVLDWGRAADESFLVTELPEGRRLDGVLESGETEHDPLAVFRDLLLAVEAARRWGVLHLGLSPYTVWVAGDGGVKVGEFGLWYVTRDYPRFGARSDPYLSPEQVSGGRASAGTDVYALALLYIALLCGPDAVRAAVDGEVLPETTGEHRPVLYRCLETQPLARYRSAGELAQALSITLSSGEEEGYIDCPVCRLKEELQRGLSSGRYPEPAFERPGVSPAAYLWLAAAALALATVMVWWLAFR